MDKDDNELVMPKAEQIPKDRFRKGDTVRAVVHRVEVINGTPKIILSRAAPAFLERLFELEVPEIYDGLIVIKNVVREPGERAKVGRGVGRWPRSTAAPFGLRWRWPAVVRRG